MKREKKAKPKGPISCNPETPPADGNEKGWRPWFCWLMWEWLEPEQERGFSPYVLTRLTDFKRRLVAVVYKRTARDKGIALNFCPFCGTSYERWLKSTYSDVPREHGAEVRP